MADDPETRDEQIARVEAMARDERGYKWDLSPNDRAALRALMDENAALRAAVAEALDGWWFSARYPGDSSGADEDIARLRALLEPK